jgi:hypothetical protein
MKLFIKTRRVTWKSRSTISLQKLRQHFEIQYSALRRILEFKFSRSRMGPDFSLLISIPMHTAEVLLELGTRFPNI